MPEDNDEEDSSWTREASNPQKGSVKALVASKTIEVRRSLFIFSTSPIRRRNSLLLFFTVFFYVYTHSVAQSNITYRPYLRHIRTSSPAPYLFPPYHIHTCIRTCSLYTTIESSDAGVCLALQLGDQSIHFPASLSLLRISNQCVCVCTGRGTGRGLKRSSGAQTAATSHLPHLIYLSTFIPICIY